MRFVTGLLCAALAAAQQLPTPSPQPSVQPDPKDSAGIEGRTLNVAGQPVRKANLTLRPMDMKPGDTPVQPYAATSDAEGKFAFEVVEPGRYQLWAERPGYMRQAYGAKRNPMQGTMLTLSAGQHMTDVNITLTPQAVISGKVTDEDGDPVARVQIRAMRQAYVNGKRRIAPSGGGMTDENGEFKVSGLLPGRYFLSAASQRNGFFGENARPATRPGSGEAAKPEEAYVTTYYPGVMDSAAATPIEVAAGRDMPGMDIRLQKSQVFRVRGKVAGGIPNQSVQRLRVMLMQTDGFVGSIGSVSSAISKDGSFDLRGVAPGSYSAAAASVEGNIQILARQPVDVGNHDIEDVVLTLQPPADLHGIVKIEGQGTADAAKAPVPGTSVIRVSLMPADGMMFSNGNATVKDDGTFVLSNVSPGKYRVNVYPGGGTYLKSVRFGNEDATTNGIDLTHGGGGNLEVVLSRNAGQIDGTVQADDQKPAQGATVTLIPDPAKPEQNYLYHQAMVDQNGQFSFKGIAPGKYRLFAWEDIEPGAQFDPEFIKRHDSQGTRVTVAENGREQAGLTVISAAAVGIQ